MAVFQFYLALPENQTKFPSHFCIFCRFYLSSSVGFGIATVSFDSGNVRLRFRVAWEWKANIGINDDMCFGAAYICVYFEYNIIHVASFCAVIPTHSQCTRLLREGAVRRQDGATKSKCLWYFNCVVVIVVRMSTFCMEIAINQNEFLECMSVRSARRRTHCHIGICLLHILYRNRNSKCDHVEYCRGSKRVADIWHFDSETMRTYSVKYNGSRVCVCVSMSRVFFFTVHRISRPINGRIEMASSSFESWVRRNWYWRQQQSAAQIQIQNNDIYGVCRRVNRARCGDYSESISNGCAPNPWQIQWKTKIILNTNWGLSGDCLSSDVRHMCRRMGAWSACECENWTRNEKKKKCTQNPIHLGFGRERQGVEGASADALVRDNSNTNGSCVRVDRVETQRLLFDLCRRALVSLVEVRTLDETLRVFIRMRTKWIDFVLELSHSFSIPHTHTHTNTNAMERRAMGLPLTLIVLKRQNEMQIFSH